MKDAPTYARKLAAYLKKLRQQHPPAPPHPPADPVTELVHAFLLQWEATRKVADAARHRLNVAMVDSNDLRVSHSDEVIRLLGERYPRVVKHTGRLLDALQEFFVREHGVTLEPLTHMGKKEARTYLDSLPGMTPYVASLVMVRCFDGHAIPVDDRLTQLLTAEGLLAPDATREQVTSFLEHHVKAGEALETHLLLQAWADREGDGAGTAARPTRKPAKKGKRKR